MKSDPTHARAAPRLSSLGSLLAPAGLVCIAALGPLPAGAQQAEPAAQDQKVVVVAERQVSRWVRAESRRFVVYSDVHDEDVIRLVENLEKLDHLLRIYTLAKPEDEPEAPRLTLYYHRRLSELSEIDEAPPAGALGRYGSCAAGVQGNVVHLDRINSLGDAQLDKSPLHAGLSVAFEAYARHFLYRHTDLRTPRSFIDGFAQYFSAVRFSDKQMVVGRVPGALGEYLRFLDEGRRYSLEYADVLRHDVSHARGLGGAAGVKLEYEAKSWLLMHYMLSSPDNRSRLRRYQGLAALGLPATAAFERAFGIKTSDIGEVMWRYRLKGLQALRVERPPLATTRVQVRTLPSAADEFTVLDAALKACPSAQAGQALLTKLAELAARFPGSDGVRLALSRAQIDWGDAEDAVPQLEAVLKNDGDHVEALHLLGAAYLRLSKQHEGEARSADLQAARHHLGRALGLSPRSPEVALALFRAAMASGGEPEAAALDGVTDAWRATRGISALSRSAALAFAYAGQVDEAVTAFDSLAQDEQDPPTAQWAKQWLGHLEVGVTRGDILAEMRQGLAFDTPLTEWTLDKAAAMQAVRLGHGLESAADAMAAHQRSESEPRRSDQP